VHPNTVIRDFGLAKVWLKRELSVGQASRPVRTDKPGGADAG